jgi:signal transduction histidine kinase
VREVGIWSLRRRLAVALGALTAVLLAVMIAAIVVLIAVRSQQRTVINRYFTAVSVADTRFTEQVDAETAVRGYALTSDPSTLQPEAALRSSGYLGEVTTLDRLIGGDRTTGVAFRAWNAAADAWYERWAAPAVAAINQRGSRAVGKQQVLAGKRLFDTNRAAFNRFLGLVVDNRNATSRGLQFRTTLLFGAVLVLLVCLATAGAFTWWGLRRWILGPLGALGAETRYVRSGALEHPVRVTGPAEVQELAGDVEDMRQAIVAQLAIVEQARAEIEAARELVESQAADLIRSNRDLEQFAYVASHDLQEPLRKVASFCQLLESRYAGQLDERADQYIGFAVDGAKRMQQLINDLLAFSRVGRGENLMAEVALQTCFDLAVANLAMTIDATDAIVTAEPLPHVRGDAGLLTQLLQNLISNAVKFRGPDPAQVRITVRDAGEDWEFACVDNGLGIEPQYADRIFVIFQRLHAKDEYTGTGIGLALCKRIVEHHGGRIWLDTEVASGSTFRWTLPKRSVDQA